MPSVGIGVMVMGGTTITILSGKAGCGKTILAVNLAVVLSDEGMNRVCLVDLDLAHGDVASALGLAAGPTLTGAMTADGHFDPNRLARVITPYVTGVDCLLAPVVPGESAKISAEFIEELLAALQSQYDYVVIDTPAEMSSRVLAAVDSSEHHVVLTTPEIPSVFKGRLALDMLDLLADHATARAVVINGADAEGSLGQAEIERVLRTPVAAFLPSSARVGMSINERVPLASSHPEHPFIQAIREFAMTRLTGVSGRALHASASSIAPSTATAATLDESSP